MMLYRVRTQREYDFLMRKLEDMGYKWGSTSLPTSLNLWYEDMVVNVCAPKEIRQDSHEFYKQEYPNELIIEVSDLMDPTTLETKIEERNNKSYSELLAELTEPLDLTNHHKEICKKLNKLYADKNHDYGNSFGETYDALGSVSAVTRISDKTNRMVSLVTKDEQRVDEEKLIDTALDLANYAIMFAMELEREEK